MTEEQYKKYGKLFSELQSVKTFLSWCGDRYKDQAVSKYRFKIITKAKNFFLYRKWYSANMEENTFEIFWDFKGVFFHIGCIENGIQPIWKKTPLKSQKICRNELF